MRPIKRKQISAIVADKLNLSADTVDEIVSCYYKHIRTMMINMDHTRICVNKLGTFVVNQKRLIEKHKALHLKWRSTLSCSFVNGHF